MPNVALVGESQAGGIISGPGASKFTVGGKPVSVLGDNVVNHGSGNHQGAVMVQGSSKLFVGGKAVVIAGNGASCGHTANGNPKMTVGG
jgi:uncharacterized Zn-binding protein involved in type VI secretion